MEPRPTRWARGYFIKRFRVGGAGPHLGRKLRGKLQTYLDSPCPDSIESGYTIVLLVKKIKFFISFSGQQLSIFAKEKMCDFRMRDASSCKGWGARLRLCRNRAPQFLVFNFEFLVLLRRIFDIDSSFGGSSIFGPPKADGI